MFLIFLKILSFNWAIDMIQHSPVINWVYWLINELIRVEFLWCILSFNVSFNSVVYAFFTLECFNCDQCWRSGTFFHRLSAPASCKKDPPPDLSSWEPFCINLFCRLHIKRPSSREPFLGFLTAPVPSKKARLADPATSSQTLIAMFKIFE